MAGLRGSGTGCIALAIALFAGLMIATAGTALYPPVAYPGAALLCGGDVGYESHGASYRPGEYTVTRQIYCQTGGGKGESEEITFRAVGLSFLIYSAFLFLLLGFVAAPLMRRRLERTLAAVPAAAASLGQILGRAGEAARGGDDPADRLARLSALRDQGLITAEDYEAKKAEILSRL
jgi:hypothetical protein